MKRVLNARTRVWLLAAIVLMLLAWVWLIVTAVTRPSPMRSMAIAEQYQRDGVAPNCGGLALAAGPYIYRFGCDLRDVGGGTLAALRFDMSRGVLDSDWRLGEPYFSAQDFVVRSASLDTQGSLTVTLQLDPEAGSEPLTYRLAPGQDAETLPAAGPGDDPPVISPASDPISASRLSEQALGKNWVVYPEYLYVLDNAGKLGAVRVITGRDNSEETLRTANYGLVGFNQIGLADGWVVVEREKISLGGWDGYHAVSDDASGLKGDIAPIPGRIFGGQFWHLAVPDPSGGFWVFEDPMTYAHFDSSLRRTDPLSAVERFERMQAEGSGVATLVILFGLIALALVAAGLRQLAGVGKSAPLLDAAPLRIASQVYILLWLVLVYWFWMATSRF